MAAPVAHVWEELLPLCSWLGDGAAAGASAAACDDTTGATPAAREAARAVTPPCAEDDGDLTAATAAEPAADGPTTDDAPLPPAPSFRCLDARHRASCLRCTAPPTEGDLAGYHLIGDMAKKNGEKKLRSLLTLTDEWGCTKARTALADSLAGDEPTAPLVTLLREKDCAALRKSSMVQLCRSWRYRSDIWQLRPPPAPPGSHPPVRTPKRKGRRASGGATRAEGKDEGDGALWEGHGGPGEATGGEFADFALDWAVFSATAPPPPPTTMVPPPPPPPSRWDWPSDPMTMSLHSQSTPVTVLHQLISGSLAPLARAAAGAWAGERALAATRGCERGLRGHNLVERLKDNTRVLQVMQALTTYIASQRALLRTWRAQLANGVPEAGATPAWSLMRGAEGPMEGVMRYLCAVVAAGESDSRRVRAEVALNGPLSVAQVTWFEELDAGIADTMRWAAHAQAAAAPMRISRFDAYLEASDMVVDLSAAYVAACFASFRRRRQWMMEMACPAPESLSDAACELNCPGLKHALSELLSLPPMRVGARFGY